MPTAADQNQDEPRFVLITQCIQNDFFLNGDCRLRLPDTIVPQMLLGIGGFDLHAGGNGPDDKRAAAIENGPFGVFLQGAVGRRIESDGLPILHVINIRDWHVPGHEYDLERRAYGSHCEAATWGVQYVDGLERFLDPTHCAKTASTRRSVRRASTTCAPTPSSTSSLAPSRVAASGSSAPPRSRTCSTSSCKAVTVTSRSRGAPPRGRFRRHSRACPQDRRERQAAHVAEDLRRGGRRVHGHQGADAARRHAYPVRLAKPGGLGHVHGVPDARTPSLRARLRREGAGRRGRPRDQRPRRLPRAARGGRGRGGPGCAVELRALPLLLPGQAERARLPGREAASVPGPHRAEVTGRLRADQAHEHVSHPLRLHVPVADARPLGPERLRARRLADRRRHRGCRAVAARVRVRVQADPRICSRISPTWPSSR